MKVSRKQSQKQSRKQSQKVQMKQPILTTPSPTGLGEISLCHILPYFCIQIDSVLFL